MIHLLLLAASAHAGVVAASAANLEAAYAPRRVAVLVGVEAYDDPKLQGLRFAAKDARDLGDVLASPDLGAFDRVVVVEGHDATTADGIARAVAIATADLQRDDTFVLYMSGHGTLTLDAAQGSRLWFLPSDGRLDAPTTTGLAVAELESMVNALPARRRVLILDTCHNGRSKSAINRDTSSLLAGMRGEPPAPRALREVSESEARLYAAQFYQPAMEDPELENGVYTHFLIQGLTGASDEADLDGDGLVDVAEAHDYARDRTIGHTGGLQVPRAEYRIVGKEEIYLSGDPARRSTAERALLSACDDLLASARLLVDGIPRGEFPGLLPVEPGRHTIEVQSASGSVLLRRKVNLVAGSKLPVESLFSSRASRLMVAAGPSVRHGAGWATFHPVAAEVEVAWLDPATPAPWLRLDLHARGTTMRGPIAEQGERVPVTAGEAGLGLSLGYHTRGFSLGPSAELVVPYRSFENSTGVHQQASVTAALGARALWTRDLERRQLALRYDVRFVPYVHDAVWTSLWHHGLAVGWTTAGR